MGGISFSSEQMSKLRSAMASAMDAIQAQDTTENPEIAVENPDAEEWDSKGTVLAKGTYVRVDDDQMTAWLYLVPPDRGQIYDKEDLVTFLQRSGIVKGFHSSNLSAMIKKKVYDREILVARGAPIQEGTDGYFEYLFTPEEYGTPKIREDGSVDYSNMSALQNVKQGDKVAVYHYAVNGVDGYNVCGGEMKAKPTRDLPPMRGKGIIRDEDTYYAQCDGKVELKDGKVDIQNVHEVMGDVDMITGKIEFFGDVIINGNVDSGVTIRAGRNIEIHGTVGGAKLFAGGDVILTRGIQGNGKISARGNVLADFIENATVEAGGYVQANYILNAKIAAQDKVITTGKRGAILGGYTHAVKGIETMTAGNEMEIKTILHCGYEPEQFDKLVEARQKEKDIKAKLSDLVEIMTDALREKRMRGSMTARTTEAKLAEWNRRKDEYFAELDRIESEQERLEEVMSRSKGTYIKIDGNLFRNVVICINSEKMILDRNTCFMKYTAERGIIEGSVIIHN